MTTDQHSITLKTYNYGSGSRAASYIIWQTKDWGRIHEVHRGAGEKMVRVDIKFGCKCTMHSRFMAVYLMCFIK